MKQQLLPRPLSQLPLHQLQLHRTAGEMLW